MEENDPVDDFDDFFDTPGRSLQDTSEKELHFDRKKPEKSSPSRSKNRDRNNSASTSASVNRSSASTVPDYSSDSVTESDSDSEYDRKRRKAKSNSRSASSRSGGSDSYSDRSYSSDSRSSSSKKKRRNRSRHSRSQSSSSSRSRSRTATPDSRGHRKKQQQKGKRRSSYSSVTSSSTYSESKDSGRRSPSPRRKEEPRRHAWNNEKSSGNSRHDRPKTAKHRSSDSKNKRGRHNGKTVAESDSDMTDVSPISSPRNGMNGHKDSEVKYYDSQPVYQAMPIDVEDSHRKVACGGDTKALDLDILMKAVSELEKQKRVKSNTRRVMFEPQRARPIDKANFTFSNDDTLKIEQENKRLLRQIMCQMHKTEERSRPRSSDLTLTVKQSTLTASAVNRRKDQKRIENDNLAFLRRLQNIRPSKGISRQEQLSAYNSTVLHGIPIATLHPTPNAKRRSGRASGASSVAGSLGRTRSMTSIHSATTASSLATSASRQSSRAGSRPGSAKKSVRERPAWNDRW